jgi:hypothetical protein
VCSLSLNLDRLISNVNKLNKLIFLFNGICTNALLMSIEFLINGDAILSGSTNPKSVVKVNIGNPIFCGNISSLCVAIDTL